MHFVFVGLDSEPHSAVGSLGGNAQSILFRRSFGIDVDSGIALSLGTGETVCFGCNCVDALDLYVCRDVDALLPAGEPHGRFSFLPGWHGFLQFHRIVRVGLADVPDRASNAQLPTQIGGEFTTSTYSFIFHSQPKGQLSL